MKKNIHIFLQHMLESIIDIEEFTQDSAKSDFLDDKKTRSAVIRQLEIIGEAAKNIPPEFRKEHPEIDWLRMAGMGDKLIHHYFKVDLDLTWEVVNTSLPDLKKKIEKILKEVK